MTFAEPLPIDAALPQLAAALAARNVAVLVAPPGAGKTTRVPLVLAREPWTEGRKIIVLEPRRLAARAAAARMASTLGEAVGDTVGYRVRFASKVSRKTHIEVVTEGVFTRMVLEDASLDRPVVVLSVNQVRGLEFDSVVVADPARIVADSASGLNDLYVAITRATQRLGVVHEGDLPGPLSRLRPR